MKFLLRNVLALTSCVFAASALAVEQSSVLSRNFSAAADSESPYSREGVQYDYVFTGAESGVWETMANWRRPADRIPYVNPYNTWGPAAFDGELMQDGTTENWDPWTWTATAENTGRGGDRCKPWTLLQALHQGHGAHGQQRLLLRH